MTVIKGNPPEAAAQQELVITRIFDAPRELVFRAWTNPEHVAQWWGPKDFTVPFCELDLRPGGAMLITMRGPDGSLYPMKGVFHDILEPERLVFTSKTFHDADGNPGLEVLNTVTFADVEGKTRLVLRSSVVKAIPEVAPVLANMEEGWREGLERLAESLRLAG